jgi:hypothetical protein
VAFELNGLCLKERKMSMRNSGLVALAALLVTTGTSVGTAWAQQAKPKQPANRAAAPAPPTDPRKAEILNSQRWRKARFEMDEWLAAQPFYNKKQVEQIKANYSAAIAQMSASDLEFMLEDTEEKFEILKSKEAQDARAWMAQNLSALTDKKRDEILKKMPNIATMTAAQLRQQIAQIQNKRQSLAEEQAAYHQMNQEQVSNVESANRAAQQAYTRDQNLAGSSTHYSPYVSQPKTRPFENVKTGPNISYSVGAFGGFRMYYNSGSF